MRKKKTILDISLSILLGALLFACTPQATEVEIEVPTQAPTVEPPPSPTSIPPTETPVPTNTPLPPTATATPVPTETPIPTNTTEPTATAEPTIDPSEVDSVSDELVVTGGYAIVGVESDDTLNVRREAGIDNDIVGEIPHDGVGVELTGDEEEIDDSLWVSIQYEADDLEGWVNASFLAEQLGAEHAAADQAREAIAALHAEDFETLADLVHPDLGVQFTPYAFISDEDIILDATEVAGLAENTTVYEWGTYDGIGGPIALTFDEYYDQFIYDVEFFSPESIGYSEFIGSGSMINNLVEAYPDALFVEYHFSGFDPDFDGLDWRSLRLVFEEKDGEWFLVGVVHSEWTT